MIGQLPEALTVLGRKYAIRSDFRNILRIISVFSSKDLSETEQVFVCLKRMYKGFEKMPRDEATYTAALQAATEFIECHLSNDRPSPKVINWEKDEQLIFPAINKVAGVEVRSLPYMHWWTFLGYFQAIDRDDLWGNVLTIRQKKAKGKKLEKHEKEFLIANRELCSMEYLKDKKSPEDAMRALYEQLLKEGGADNG